VDLEAVFQHARTFPDSSVKRLADSLVLSPLCAHRDVPDVQMFQTLRLGLAIMDLAVKHDYIGTAIKSWPELFDVYGCAADGAVSMLNDAGLCTAEEGEMHGLISSLALYLLSDGRAVPTMMDISSVDSIANRIGIWHCGASPTRLLKPGTKLEARKHSILENADEKTAVGLMVEFLLATGAATVVRYHSPAAARCLAFEGEMMDCSLAFRGAYGEMVPKPPATAGDVISAFMAHGLDHHWSLGYGSWKSGLRMLNHWLGVAEVAVAPTRELSGLSHHGATSQ
jgi:L-fucose isomerase-like protein